MQNQINRVTTFVRGVWFLLILSVGLLTSGCSAAVVQSAAPTAVPGQAPDLAVVTAEGRVMPVQRATLSFKTGGRVVAVLVGDGDAVKQGNVLARLDDATLQKQIAQTQAQLATAQAQLAQADAQAELTEKQLAQLKAGGTDADIAAAQSALNAAFENYNKVKEGPTADELGQLKANLDNAKAAVAQAQSAYDKVGGASNPNSGMLPQSVQLQQAANSYDAALAAYDDARSHPTASEVAAASAQIQQAQDALARLKPTQQALDVAQAQVDAAQAARDTAQTQVVSAQAALEVVKAQAADYVLVAPFDGTVADKNVDLGQVVQASAPAFDIGDLSRLQVETKDLTEVDVARVTLGQMASVICDALPGKTLSGKVLSIAPEANDYRGDQVYKVTIGLSDAASAGLRWGMTANVSMQVNK